MRNTVTGEAHVTLRPGIRKPPATRGGPYCVGMLTNSRSAQPCSAAANRQIRELVNRVGRQPWTAEELAELDRLRAVWLAAVRAGKK